MNEPKAGIAVAQPLETGNRKNRGWFRAGDRRINREGRPYGSKATVSKGDAPDCAQQADRVKRLSIGERDLDWRLTRQNGPWVINLPGDYQIVASRVDRGRVVLIIRSGSFPRIAKGTPIPDFEPAFNGLKWRRLAGQVR